MHSYFVEAFKINGLWGYRDINLTFHKDVNILIGLNASGKTTTLNLLHSVLSADLRSILNFNFEHAEIKLRGFKDRSERTVKVEITDRFLKFSVGRNKFEVDIGFISDRMFSRYYMLPGRGEIARGNLPRSLTGRIIEIERLYDILTSLVPLVWLPVSRRLPVITDSEEERYPRADPLESVDLRVKELLEGLSRYHSILNAQLSERYREFERQVLSVILYNKDHDQLHSIFDSLPSSLPTEAEKDQLRSAFNAAGLLDKQMRSRIDDHFAAAEKAVERIREDKNAGVELEDVLVVPLIRRTQSMVEYAGKLEKDRENIFAPLRLYEKTVNSFLDDKSVEVDGGGELKIKLSSSLELDWHLLSSGEKQILILLTEALLQVDKPVVYIADEPELSLHVTWQEKLLESLVSLGGDMQVIVATHSPDIVGKFRDNVIALGRES